MDCESKEWGDGKVGKYKNEIMIGKKNKKSIVKGK